MMAIIALLAAASCLAQVSITANSPKYNWQVLAGSVRHINVGITNGTGNLVNWSVSAATGGGSATLSCANACLPIIDVTIGSTAGTCSISGSLGSYTVGSTVSVTVQAQSVDDNSKTTSFLFNVCSTTIQTAVVPFYRTLYNNQLANLQAYVIGSANQDVTWSITAQPGGGNGVLSDSGNHDTVFHASVAGRYTIQALSSADGSTTATAIMYVTGNSIPRSVTLNGTTPVDCTADPALTGTVYTVGSGKAFASLGAVPLNTMASGSTVQVYNTDMTGSSPTVYAEYIQLGLSHTGSAAQPLRIVGCPDSLGNLPILDANNAVGASWVCTNACAGFGIVSIWPGNSFGLYQTGNNQANYIIVEGFHLRNAQPSNSYTTPSGGTSAWLSGASCVNIRGAYFIVILGNEIENCSNGTFADSNTNSNAWKGNVFWTDWEGNNIHGNGISGNSSVHQLYIQGWGQLVQFNQIHDSLSGMLGASLKTRGLGDVIRYNWIGSGDANTRLVDMIDAQDASCYVTFEGYLDSGSGLCAYWNQGDTMGPNVLAAWQEAWHYHFLYGNVLTTAANATQLIHFGYDHDAGMSARLGTLYYYNDTLYANAKATFVIIDDDGGGNNHFNVFEFQKVSEQNSITWTPSACVPGFSINNSCLYFNHLATLSGNFTTNLWGTTAIQVSTPINGGPLNNQQGAGWSNATTSFSYPLAAPLDGHQVGLSSGNFLTASTAPFNTTTFRPVNPQNGSALTGIMAKMPVRFEYQPNVGYPIPREVPVTSSVGDVIGALSSGGSGSSTFGPVTHAGPVTKF